MILTKMKNEIASYNDKQRSNKKMLYEDVYGRMRFDNARTVIAFPGTKEDCGYDIDTILRNDTVPHDGNFIFVENGTSLRGHGGVRDWKGYCTDLYDRKYSFLANKHYFFDNLTSLERSFMKERGVGKADLAMLDICGMFTKDMRKWIYSKLFTICRDGADVFFTFNLLGPLRNKNKDWSDFAELDDEWNCKYFGKIVASYGFRDTDSQGTKEYWDSLFQILNWIDAGCGGRLFINNVYVYKEVGGGSNVMSLIHTTVQ